MASITISNPRFRDFCYGIWAIAALALVSITLFCNASNGAYVQPNWVTPAYTVVMALGGILGFVAKSHTDTTVASSTTLDLEAEPEPGTVPAQ
jgi:hypothetical protein